MRKSNFLFCIFFLTSLFISCEHSLDVKPHGNQETSTCTVIKGFLTDKFSGAAPADFENLQPSQNSSARNAIPEVTINDLQYEIYACKYDSLNGTEDTSTRVDVPDDKFNSSTMTFEIELPDAVWKIHAIGSDDLGNILVEGSSVITMNSFESSSNGNDTDQTINISLHLAQSATGTGTVNLPFSFESDSLINYIEATWIDLGGGSHTKTMLSSSFIFDMNGDDSWGTSGIPSGVYKVTFRFYNYVPGSSYCLYVIPEEEIVVLSGKETSKWINNADSQYITAEGSFSVTNTQIRDAHKNAYVDVSATIITDQENDGSRYEPYSSLNTALGLFYTIDSEIAETEHQVFVSGDISEIYKYNSSNLDSFYFPIKNKKLTIKGLSSTKPGKISQGGPDACAFYVESNATLELGENLTISGFNNIDSPNSYYDIKGNGGAVHIGNGGKLILNSCKIKNCEAYCGSAIYSNSENNIIFSGKPVIEGYTYKSGNGLIYLESNFSAETPNKFYLTCSMDPDSSELYPVISKNPSLSYDYNTNFEICGYTGVHFPGTFQINSNGEITGSIPTPQVTASMPSTIYVGTELIDTDTGYAEKFFCPLITGMGVFDHYDDLYSNCWNWEEKEPGSSQWEASLFSGDSFYFFFKQGINGLRLTLKNDFTKFSTPYEWEVVCDSKYDILGNNYESSTLGHIAIVNEDGDVVSIIQKPGDTTNNVSYSELTQSKINSCINAANVRTASSGLVWRLPTVQEGITIAMGFKENDNNEYWIWLQDGYAISLMSGILCSGQELSNINSSGLASIRLIADVSSTPGVPGDSDYTSLDDFSGTLTIAKDGKYIVSSETGLKKFAEAWNSNPPSGTDVSTEIKLAGNIELTGQWTPINGFKGVFDGNGKTISGLNVSVTSEVDSAGLISSIGDNSNGQTVIKNLSVKGTVQGNDNVGGIIGTADKIVIIDNCFNYAEISGSKTVGGIIGNCAVYNSVISNCINYGSIKGTGQGVGGIVGTVSSIFVLNSANFGDITGDDGVGGLVGNGSGLTLKNSFNAGIVKVNGGNPSFYGSVCGIGLTASNVWYEDNTCKNNTVYGAAANPSNSEIHKFVYSNVSEAGKSNLDDLKSSLNTHADSQSDYNKWNGSYNAYPVYSGNFGSFIEEKTNVIYANTLYTDPTVYNSETVPSSGQKCAVGSQSDLVYINTMLNNGNSLSGVTFIVLTEDITVSNWKPIGATNGNNVNNGFRGIFDGNGCTITINGLDTTGDTDCYGFFGFVQNAEIRNLTIIGNYTVAGKSNVGGIIGRATVSDNEKLVIENCNSYVYITDTSSSGENYGGIVGKFENWTTTDAENNFVIKNCNNFGNISCRKSAGGIIGYAPHEFSILNCSNQGKISVSSTGAGGIVGNLANLHPAIISNCVNIGEINTSETSGSIIGICDDLSGKQFDNLFYVVQSSLNVISIYSTYSNCYSIEKSGNTYVLVAGQDLEGDVLSLLIDNAHNNGWADWTTDTSGNLMVAN
ncbi:MAG: hypothetical protein MJ160_00120 [Treponema sp.]|nr:hypothetical protein [Treponema sp.]